MKKVSTLIILVVVLVAIFIYYKINSSPEESPDPENSLPPGTVIAPDGSLFQEPLTGPPAS